MVSDYDRMQAVATNAERLVIAAVAKRAGVVEEEKLGEDRVIDNRIVHRPDCDCAECLVGATRQAESWDAFWEEKFSG
jgi:hypothetical protein